MKATEAVSLSQKANRVVLIEPLRKFVDAKIKEAAEKGRHSIVYPTNGYSQSISGDLEEALWQSLRQDGFKVKHHPDPDPGHPCSHPYDEVSW